MPDGSRRDHFLSWIETLSDRQTPSWLGLPNNAEKVLLTTRGQNLLWHLYNKLRALMTISLRNRMSYTLRHSDAKVKYYADGVGNE